MSQQENHAATGKNELSYHDLATLVGDLAGLNGLFLLQQLEPHQLEAFKRFVACWQDPSFERSAPQGRNDEERVCKLLAWIITENVSVDKLDSAKNDQWILLK